MDCSMPGFLVPHTYIEPYKKIYMVGMQTSTATMENSVEIP